jgi:capsular exopolysaccharide synthesis family protein
MSRVGDALLRVREGGQQSATAELAPGWVLPVEAAAPNPWLLEDGPTPAPVVVRPVLAEAPAPAPVPEIRDEPATGVEPVSSPEMRNEPATGNTRLPNIHPDVADRVITSNAVSFQVVEHYRRLAAALHEAHADRGIKVVMITSAVQGEGKSLTAANLALTLSQSYRRHVLLVDADLRRPTLHQIFQVPSTSGLSDGLRPGGGTFTTFRSSDTLTVLPAGRPESDPMAGLTSPRMAQLVADARQSYDWIILDTPPVSLMPDAKLLAAMADSVLLVIAAGAADLDSIKLAVKAVGRKKVLGAVFNRADNEPTEGYYYQD